MAISLAQNVVPVNAQAYRPGGVVPRRISKPATSPVPESQSLSNTTTSNDRPQPPKAGFGEGTISAPMAAMRTLDTNLEQARAVVPTLAEIRKQAQEKAAETIRALQARREKAAAQPPPTVEQVDIPVVRKEPETTVAPKETAPSPVPREAAPAQMQYTSGPRGDEPADRFSPPAQTGLVLDLLG